MANEPNREKVPFAMRLSDAFGGWLLRRLSREALVEGLENVPSTGGAILVSNHLSWIDPVFLACWLTPATGRPITWMGKAEALRWPLLGAFLRANGVFGVRRGTADLGAFRLAERTLRDGNLLGIYAEGTRSRDGRLAPFLDGAALLALRSGVPVLPVAVSGTERLWPTGSLLPHPGARIHLTIGPPLQLSASAQRTDVAAAAGHLRDAVARLLPEAYRP